MGKKYKLSEGDIKNAVKSVVTEFFNRDDMDSMSNFGIKDPTEDSVVNEEEIKQKCAEFVQKTNEYTQYLNQFYAYIDGAEEDTENGVQETSGVRGAIRSRNLFGARNLADEYLEENLNNLSDSLNRLKYAISEAIECAESC